MTEQGETVVLADDESVSIVRRNLMSSTSYRPYCGADRCSRNWPRTLWNGRQFECKCGWQSSFEPEFIAAFKKRLAEATQSAE